MIGLTWDAINWEKRTLTVDKTLEYRYQNGCWRAGPPKTKQSYRTIPLTDRAYEILEQIYASRTTRNSRQSLPRFYFLLIAVLVSKDRLS